MAKLNRERKLQEKRLQKQARKDERKQQAAAAALAPNDANALQAQADTG